ncbi:hypothetical protein [Rhodococcus pyridinivorans]|uniref:hypothetical protein n=1 Tax=Rhodococcus pyridinivorans TaxID=103816 RepID=UPI003AAFEC10
MTTAAELEAAFINGEDVTIAQIEKARKAEALADLEARRDAAGIERARAEKLEADREVFREEVAAFIEDIDTIRATYDEALVVLADLANQVRARQSRQTQLAAQAQSLGLMRKGAPVNAGNPPLPEVATEWRSVFIESGVIAQLVEEARIGYHAANRGRVGHHSLVSNERRADYRELRGLQGDELRTRARALLDARVKASQDA